MRSIEMMKTFRSCISLAASLCLVRTLVCSAFVAPSWCCYRRGQVRCSESENDTRPSSYETTDASSKGIVSSLTGLINFIMTPKTKDDDQNAAEFLSSSPTSAVDLMNRIRDDYTINNYLWTGNIDLAAFEKDCRFTDPTLSFVGTDKFVSNVQNLRPIVDSLIQPPGGCCRSDLLDICVHEKENYVQTRWNMVGELNALLPWKPKIDVIGRTKFWYREGDDGYYRVYFYDECWEIPAAQALLQLLTPAGTIPNSRVQ